MSRAAIRGRARAVAAFAVVVALACGSAFGVTSEEKKRIARNAFEKAEELREELNGRPVAQRSRKDYQQVIDAYRKVYYTTPAATKADVSIMAVAELLAEVGRNFKDEKSLKDAIGQYEFLRKDYPGSGLRIQALFTIAQIYRDDLLDAEQARATYQELITKYPRSRLAADAHDALVEMEVQAAAKSAAAKIKSAPISERRSGEYLVTGIRHWATPDYTRVAIDIESEVKFEAGRVGNPDRIFFDLHDTRLASVLVGKSFDVQDGFLHKIRVAQFQRGLTRVVLEVDDVAEYSAFLLPNPYRLIIDIHGKNPKRETLVAKNEGGSENPRSGEAKTIVIEPKKPGDVRKVIVEADPEPGSTRVEDDGKSSKTEVAKLSAPELKTKTKPNTEPVFEEVAPRKETKKKPRKVTEEEVAKIRQATPASNGETSLIRALGLKIGKIVIDAGHGGHDTGTIGPNGLMEKDLVLDVALRLGKLLEGRLGADVVYTRDDDTFIPLETRTAVANQNQADLFLSIHANSSRDPDARGIETYYLNFTSSPEALEVAARENAVSEKSIHELQDLVKKITLKEKINESRELAANVQKSLHSGLSVKVPTLRNRGVKKAPFIVLIGANMPSVLAEVSFLSNPQDEKNLKKPAYRQRVAESLFKGVEKYVGGLSGLKIASKVSPPE
jgi:N-acetylmuramoyl-L-alanine amidase